MPMRNISCPRCYEALCDRQLWKGKHAAEELRAEAAEQRSRDAEAAAELQATQHATQLNERRAAHSERTAHLIRTCSAETEALQEALAGLQARKVELAAELATAQGALKAVQRELKATGEERKKEGRLSGDAAAAASKAEAQHVRQLAAADASNAKLLQQVAKLGKLTRSSAGAELKAAEKQAQEAETREERAEKLGAELKRELKAAGKREKAWTAERQKHLECQLNVERLEGVLRDNFFGGDEKPALARGSTTPGSGCR